MKQTKLQFIERLLKLSHCTDEMMQFLVNDKLLNDQEVQAIRNAVDQPRLILSTLEGLKKQDKLLLLDFEWLLLPVERLKLTLITEREKREFVYNF